MLLLFLAYRHKRLRIEAIPWEDLHVDGDAVLGKSSLGLVLKGRYQGTAVAVKRALPRVAPGGSLFDMDDAMLEDLLEGRRGPECTEHAAYVLAKERLALALEYFGIHDARRKQVREVQGRASARLRHSNIVPMLGVTLGPDGRELLVVNVYLERGTLHDLLCNPSVAIDEILTTSIARDIAAALQWCHMQHPPMLGANLRTHHILLDTNLRAHIGTGTSRIDKRSVWMAPELLAGKSRTESSDVYAYGMLMYTLLSRQEPFQGEDEREVIRAIRDSSSVIPKRPDVSGIDKPLRQLLERCWDGNPRARPDWSEINAHLTSVNRKSLADDLLAKVHRGQALLHAVYPPNVAQALQEGRTPEPEYHPCVTIFFSDLMGFTRVSGSLEPGEVMRMLHAIYSGMDALAEKNGVYKVETIGDAWMGVTNLRQPQPDHAARMADFAMEVMGAVTTELVPSNQRSGREAIRIRIGLHTGDVTAGVVGSLNPRYCLFGDSVNVASRMESTCEPDKIQLSRQAAHAVVAQRQDMQSRIVRRPGLVDVKGKGMLKTYYLMTDNELASLPSHSSSRGSFELR